MSPDQTIPDPLIGPELIERIARTTMEYPFKVWGYGEGIGLDGLLRAAEATGQVAFEAFVHGLVDGWVAARPTVSFVDHVAPGTVLLGIHARTGDERLLLQARRLADLFAGLPRTARGTALHRPDDPTFSTYAYVDCTHVDAPFLCKLAEVTGESRFRDLGLDLLRGHVQVLRDQESGLFFHLYDDSDGSTNGALWGRGNGWAMLGLVETLEALPADDPAREELEHWLTAQAAAVATLQDASGHWHTVLDDPSTYLETSLAAFFCAGLTRAVRAGLLPVQYLAPAAAAMTALVSRIDHRGVVQGVSQATPPGSARDYGRVPVGGPFPWGQGPALLAACAQMSVGQEQPGTSCTRPT